MDYIDDVRSVRVVAQGRIAARVDRVYHFSLQGEGNSEGCEENEQTQHGVLIVCSKATVLANASGRAVSRRGACMRTVRELWLHFTSSNDTRK